VSHGLRTFGADGRRQLDIDRRVLQYVQTDVIGDARKFGQYSFAVPGMSDNGQWIVDCPAYPHSVKLFAGYYTVFLFAGKHPQSTVTPQAVVNVFHW
jgi:hypothetical protein